MTALRDLQGQVRHAVVTGDNRPLESLLTGGGDPRERLAIHHRHYEASLVTALLAKFPATTWLLGSDFIADAARAYVRACPPRRPCIAEYGDTFPAFLAARPHAETLGYLRDFAALEQLFGEVAVEVRTTGLDPAVLATLDDATLTAATVALQTGLRYLETSWPVDDLLRLFLDDVAPARFEMAQLDIHLQIDGGRGQVGMERLSAGDFTFRRALRHGAPIGVATACAVVADPDFDLVSALTALITHGLATAIVPGPPTSTS